jgi:ribosomal protein L24
MSKFKIGDRVKIVDGCAKGEIGTIVKSSTSPGVWTIKIPGFDGHVGDIEDGTTDKWYVSEENLTKLPPEKESMKIEVKQTKKTEKPKEIVYPCFRRSILGTYMVVLFFSETSGIVVDQGISKKFCAGVFREDWVLSNFSEPLQNYSATISRNP